MNSDKQRSLQTFVDREVIMRVSYLIEDLLQAAMNGGKVFGGIALDNIENLYITDEETAEDYGFTSLEAIQETGDDRQEVFEWWFVSQWLYEQLRKAGEPVIDSDYGNLWGRTCTGQPIMVDNVIEIIFDSLTNNS